MISDATKYLNVHIMQSNYSNQVSASDKVIAVSLATFSMFVVGYTATRVFLGQMNTDTNINIAEVNVVPHQASLWSDLGK